MYHMPESNCWLISENCAEPIERIPQLVRHEGRREDIRKVEGDDSAGSARYGLVSGVRLAGVGPAFMPARAGEGPPYNSAGGTPHFGTGMPLGEQIARSVSATAQTSREIHYHALAGGANEIFRPREIRRTATEAS